MIIKTEQSLQHFEFWSGAKELAERLTWEELTEIEHHLEELYPNGLTETELNDFFWFDSEFICNIIGETEEDIFNR
jgi:DNA-binding GntR family transcriptional regulator